MRPDYSPRNKDPIQCWKPTDSYIPPDGPGWYFFDMWFRIHGPFASKQECKEALINYTEAS